MILVTVAIWQATEPFFYDSAYKLVKKEYALPIDTNGRCITAKNGAHPMKFQDIQLSPMKWECSSECKILSDSDVCTIIDLDIVFAGGAWILKNEQRNRHCCQKRANTSGVGKSNNYYEDIYIPPYSNTH